LHSDFLHYWHAADGVTGFTRCAGNIRNCDLTPGTITPSPALTIRFSTALLTTICPAYTTI
jgi:hypothetical protein